jgi:hypothetical protein
MCYNTSMKHHTSEYTRLATLQEQETASWWHHTAAWHMNSTELFSREYALVCQEHAKLAYRMARVRQGYDTVAQ